MYMCACVHACVCVCLSIKRILVIKKGRETPCSGCDRDKLSKTCVREQEIFYIVTIPKVKMN